MIKIPYENIISKIKETAGISEQEIDAKIDAKLKQLSGLISKEGAAHIIANELGVKLFENISGKLEIKNILSGMRSVETIGRVTQVFDVREFNTGERSGRVGSFVLSDQSGSIRIVCWGDQCDNLRQISPNTIVKISGGYVRENQGRKEVHLNDKSALSVNPNGVDIPDASNLNVRKHIKELTSNDEKVELLATIVQVFEPKFYEVCPVCNKRARLREDKYECLVHGNIKPEFSYVINTFIDDGTDNMRATFFSNQAEKLTKKQKQEMIRYKDDIESFNDVKNELMGKIVKIIGRVQKNEMFDRLEFIANDINLEPDPNKEIEELNKTAEKLNKESIAQSSNQPNQ
ncbi:MAG: OB-fold nucleic acid binding domain-containing protein [Candidatus Woesearchaeota archaeon]